ncbi:protein indeterminate-domain 7-like [Tasmannia lanceolata]|uniref:protein indeterminate-domain 7-like n=1 Tax=Tasmannia lanceolata TaxID=3420 RepID=UPI004062DFCC
MSKVHENFQNMSNTSQEDEDFQNTLLQQPFDGSSGPTRSNGEDFRTPIGTKKRNLPGNPDPDAEVIALSPRTLMATNRYMCEVCHKGFQRDQNLQLHRRGHNLPWKLKQRTSGEVKKRVYICPETNCVHHDPSRALGDLTGVKKHYYRKHGEKKWKCDKCSKRYAVQSDWKAHAKICGTREYRCDCGTIFSRRDSFITHRAFCDALAEENYKVQQSLSGMGGMLKSTQSHSVELLPPSMPTSESFSNTNTVTNPSISDQNMNNPFKSSDMNSPGITLFSNPNSVLDLGTLQASYSGIGSAYMSATALLQKAAEMGSVVSDNSISPVFLRGFVGYSTSKRSYESVQEACHDPSDASNSLYMGNQYGIEKTSECGNIDMRPFSTVLQDGSLASHLLMNLENRNKDDTLVGGFPMGGMQKGFHEGVQKGGCDRPTVDFLSLGPVRHLSTEDGSCEDNMIGLSYSNYQHIQDSMDSYHHLSNDPTTLEKPMWNF